MADQVKLHGKKYWIFVLTLLAGTFTMSISQSALSTAYPTLMRYFHINASAVQWLTTGFMLIMTVMIPVSPWLLANIPFKKLFISLLIIFDVGTLLIIWAPNFGTMLLGRALEAVAVGVLFPSYQTVLLDITDEEQRGTVMGFAGLVMGSALAVGPIVSGVVLHFFAWQGVFILFFVVLTVVALIAIQTVLSPLSLQHSKLDIISVLSSFSFIGFLYVLTTSGKNLSWNKTLTIILLSSVVGLIIFIWRQLTNHQPLLQLRVLQTFNFDLAVLLTGFSYVSLIVVTIIFPLYYQNVLHLSPFISGIALVPGAVVLSVLNPLTGILADKLGFKLTLSIGTILIVIGWLGLFVLNENLTIWWLLLLAAIIEGGNAFVMMPATTMGANALPKQFISHGTAVITTLRQILGALGVALATILLALPSSAGSQLQRQQQQFHWTFGVFLIISVVDVFFAAIIRDVSIKSKK
ncbi:MFS transporter [Bombilactobacillus thymidiniphilus]|uniref:MFS transporter n=1 Tax=Bombilactobacillus thymidiniphilus TaxID=2923363 RepID=A0ABY4PF68_9LACO|nr:MFS transporter [Bombilactobacillus thymidiniphilus]UQS84181.1 MFS transporter [Bombilactobacillus thymidiniphilus]